MIFSLMIISAFILIGCKSREIIPFHKAKCVNSSQKDLSIKIGNRINTKDTVFYNGIEIFTNGLIQDYLEFDIKGLTQKANITQKKYRISEEEYCNLYYFAKKIVLEVPALNEIGDTLNLFEFVNVNTNTYFRNLWHPRFKTKGSLKTRNYIDSINLILKNKIEIE
jgi:hypothetical protein